MVLAAGLGTRLRPLTDDRPKALVEVAGQTLLAITFARLRACGVTEVIVNVHHFAAMVVDYLAANRNFGIRIEVSREDELLDTGGGLKKAAWFFLEKDADKDQPFLLHNVDVLSTIDLAAMTHAHIERGSLATLAVQHRRTSRPLLFNEQGQFQGRAAKRENVLANCSSGEPAQPAPAMQELAFAGIHVLSPRIFAMMPEQGAFSIIDTYVRVAAQQEKIAAFPADNFYWRDLGRPENIVQAKQDVEMGIYPHD